MVRRIDLHDNLSKTQAAERMNQNGRKADDGNDQDDKSRHPDLTG